MRRMSLTSLLTLGGILIAVMQMMRMRSQPRGIRRVTHMLNNFWGQPMRYLNHMLRGVNWQMPRIMR